MVEVSCAAEETLDEEYFGGETGLDEPPVSLMLCQLPELSEYV